MTRAPTPRAAIAIITVALGVGALALLGVLHYNPGSDTDAALRAALPDLEAAARQGQVGAGLVGLRPGVGGEIVPNDVAITPYSSYFLATGNPGLLTEARAHPGQTLIGNHWVSDGGEGAHQTEYRVAARGMHDPDVVVLTARPLDPGAKAKGIARTLLLISIPFLVAIAVGMTWQNRDAPPVALWLAAGSIFVFAAVVLRASSLDIYRCADGYTNRTKEYFFSTVLIAIPVVALLGQHLLLPNDPGRVRLAPRYLVGIVVLAAVAIVASLSLLRGRPELPCFD